MEFEFSLIHALLFNGLILGILFIATLSRGTFGFGDGLIAVPFMVMFLGARAAAPLMAMVGGSMAVVMFLKDLKTVDWSATWRLVLGALFGIPVGIYFLQEVPEAIAAGALGILLLLFSIYSLSGFAPPKLKSDRVGYLFGFFGGCLAGAWNTAGPPIVLFGTLKRWPPARFRVTLQGFFVPINLALIASHFAAGNLTSTVLGVYFAAIPLGILALYIGKQLNGLIPPEKFSKVLYTLLFVLGTILVTRSGFAYLA
jgi:uncharacterized protein